LRSFCWSRTAELAREQAGGVTARRYARGDSWSSRRVFDSASAVVNESLPLSLDYTFSALLVTKPVRPTNVIDPTEPVVPPDAIPVTDIAPDGDAAPVPDAQDPPDNAGTHGFGKSQIRLCLIVMLHVVGSPPPPPPATGGGVPPPATGGGVPPPAPPLPAAANVSANAAVGGRKCTSIAHVRPPGCSLTSPLPQSPVPAVRSIVYES
jgi:hypothetical protein